MLEERDRQGNALIRQYVQGAHLNEVLQLQDYTQGNPLTYYYLTDALGSIVGLTDTAGSVVQSIKYDGYGQAQTLFGAIANPLLFTAAYLDQESNLYHFRNRYYDPTQGRFISRDPIGMWTDVINSGNGYAYVGNNPVNWNDPSGLTTFDDLLVSPRDSFVDKVAGASAGIAVGIIAAVFLPETLLGVVGATLIGAATAEISALESHNKRIYDRRRNLVNENFQGSFTTNVQNYVSSSINRIRLVDYAIENSLAAEYGAKVHDGVNASGDKFTTWTAGEFDPQSNNPFEKITKQEDGSFYGMGGKGNDVDTFDYNPSTGEFNARLQDGTQVRRPGGTGITDIIPPGKGAEQFIVYPDGSMDMVHPSNGKVHHYDKNGKREPSKDRKIPPRYNEKCKK